MKSRKSGFEVHAKTDVGRVRERNEDSFVTLDLGTSRTAGGRVTPLSTPGLLLAVCDGLGGAAGGDVASRIAAETLRERIANGPKGHPSGERTLLRQLREGIMQANARVREEAAARPELEGMGTTVTAALISGHTALFGQVGDSRAYLVRSGTLIPTTRDQSLGIALLDLGILSSDQLEALHGANILLQAVGSDEDLEIIFTKVSLCRGDVVVLCSDGLSGVVPETEICDCIVRSRSMRSACERLVKLALAAGGPDNITVLLCRAEGASLPAATSYGPRVSIVET